MKQTNKWKIVAVIAICLLVAVSVCYGLELGDKKENDKNPEKQTEQVTGKQDLNNQKVEPETDYSEMANWAYFGIGDNKKADLFLICPTVDMNDEYNMSLSDEKTKESFVGALNMERGIYEENCRMYAPFYRQSAMAVYGLDQEQWEPYMQIAYSDVSAAFSWYLENENDSLTDYKFYCFDGKPMWYGIFYDRYTDKSIDFYDENGKKMDGVNTCHIKNSNKIEAFDDKIKEMMRLSKKLSNIFTCVRVDFYCVDEKIIFGELTFTDGAGSDPWYPINFDLEISSKLQLKHILKI